MSNIPKELTLKIRGTNKTINVTNYVREKKNFKEYLFYVTDENHTIVDLNKELIDFKPPDYILFTEEDKREEEELLLRAKSVQYFLCPGESPENATRLQVERAEQREELLGRARKAVLEFVLKCLDEYWDKATTVLDRILKDKVRLYVENNFDNFILFLINWKVIDKRIDFKIFWGNDEKKDEVILAIYDYIQKNFSNWVPSLQPYNTPQFPVMWSDDGMKAMEEFYTKNNKS
jgi:hypothetical protein